MKIYLKNDESLFGPLTKRRSKTVPLMSCTSSWWLWPLRSLRSAQLHVRAARQAGANDAMLAGASITYATHCSKDNESECRDATMLVPHVLARHGAQAPIYSGWLFGLTRLVEREAGSAGSRFACV